MQTSHPVALNYENSNMRIHSASLCSHFLTDFPSSPNSLWKRQHSGWTPSTVPTIKNPYSSTSWSQVSDQTHDHSGGQTQVPLDVVNVHADQESVCALGIKSSSQEIQVKEK